MKLCRRASETGADGQVEASRKAIRPIGRPNRQKTGTNLAPSLIRHYSAAELGELLAAVEKIVDRGVAQTPTLSVVRWTGEVVGKLSESGRG